jgi:hypothetical protein
MLNACPISIPGSRITELNQISKKFMASIGKKRRATNRITGEQTAGNK